MKSYWLHFTGKQRLSNQHNAIYIFLFANICFNEEDIEARKNYIYGHFSPKNSPRLSAFLGISGLSASSVSCRKWTVA